MTKEKINRQLNFLQIAQVSRIMNNCTKYSTTPIEMASVTIEMRSCMIKAGAAIILMPKFAFTYCCAESNKEKTNNPVEFGRFFDERFRNFLLHRKLMITPK